MSDPIDPNRIYERKVVCELLGNISSRTFDRIPETELPRVQISPGRIGCTGQAIINLAKLRTRGAS